MERKLYNNSQIEKAIKEGRKLILTADKKTIENLPKGNWIAGTIPYFMDQNGGVKNTEEIFVDDFTDSILNFNIKTYNIDNIKNIIADSYENGFTVLILPAASEILKSFALNSFDYENIFKNPIVGYVAGYDLESGQTTAYTFNGKTLEQNEKKAVAIHFELPEDKIAQVEIINIFSPNKKLPKIQFFQNSFVQKYCLINGKKEIFADYIKQNNIDTKLPLIQIQNGAIINKSIMQINSENETEFYAPLFNGIDYYFAEKIEDYENKLNIETLKIDNTNIHYSCNCILNYLYGNLEGKKLKITGATTFGEIAYQLLNQTQIYLNIKDI